MNKRFEDISEHLDSAKDNAVQLRKTVDGLLGALQKRGIQINVDFDSSTKSLYRGLDGAKKQTNLMAQQWALMEELVTISALLTSSLDLDEVAKGGGEASERQTAVMYMLARYVLAKDYYLTEDNVRDMPEAYQQHHAVRVAEIREDAKRIVFDEFHRTSSAKAVRDQVIFRHA